jgi:hypothetical protein
METEKIIKSRVEGEKFIDSKIKNEYENRP